MNDKKHWWGVDDLTKLTDICMRIANLVIESKDHEDSFCNELGLGYMVVIDRLMNGVAAIAKMKAGMAETRSRMEIEQVDSNEARATLDDLLGDRDIDSLNDALYSQVKAFIEKQGVKEYIRKINEGGCDNETD